MPKTYEDLSWFSKRLSNFYEWADRRWGFGARFRITKRIFMVMFFIDLTALIYFGGIVAGLLAVLLILIVTMNVVLFFSEKELDSDDMINRMERIAEADKELAEVTEMLAERLDTMHKVEQFIEIKKQRSKAEYN